MVYFGSKLRRKLKFRELNGACGGDPESLKEKDTYILLKSKIAVVKIFAQLLPFP